MNDTALLNDMEKNFTNDIESKTVILKINFIVYIYFI